MVFLNRLLATAVVMGAFVMVSAPRAGAQQLSVQALTSEVVVQGDTAQATFKIEVTNSEESKMTDVWVVFKDGSAVSIPDVDARSSAVSETVSKTVELTMPDSHNIPVPVTLKLTIDGTSVERPSGITLTKD